MAILDQHGQPMTSSRGLSLDRINEIALQQVRAELNKALFQRIVRLYDADGKIVYTNLGDGLKGLAETLRNPLEYSWSGNNG